MEANGTSSLIVIISSSLKLVPILVIILKSLIISVCFSFFINFKRTATSSSAFGNSDIITPLIADLTCSPISEIDKPKDCPLLFKLKILSCTPNSRLSLNDVTPGIVLAI